MLPSWLVRLVLALAFAVLPLQGLAETTRMLLCEPQSPGTAGAREGQGHDGASAHVHAGAHHGHDVAHADHGAGPRAGGDVSPSHHAAMPDEASAEGHAGHYCCDVVVAGLTGSAPGVGQFDFPALEAAREISRASIFLEYPQRPPLV